MSESFVDIWFGMSVIVIRLGYLLMFFGCHLEPSELELVLLLDFFDFELHLLGLQ